MMKFVKVGALARSRVSSAIFLIIARFFVFIQPRVIISEHLSTFLCSAALSFVNNLKYSKNIIQNGANSVINL